MFNDRFSRKGVKQARKIAEKSGEAYKNECGHLHMVMLRILKHIDWCKQIFGGHNLEFESPKSLCGDKNISFWRSKITYFDSSSLELSIDVLRNFITHLCAKLHQVNYLSPKIQHHSFIQWVFPWCPTSRFLPG